MTADLRIQDLVDHALAASIDLAAADTRATTLKAAAVAEAERIRVSGMLVDRFPSQQRLGNLRLDGADATPRVSVEKPSEWADWLAQHQPDLVTTRITVPAAQLAAALEALEFSGVTGVTAAVEAGPDAGRWMDEHCHPVADPDDPLGGYVVRNITTEGISEHVPGLKATKPAPRWVLTADSALKRERSEQAAEEARAEIGQAGHQEPSPAADVAVLASEFSEATLAALSKADLIQRCKDLGILATGTKPAMAKRIAAHVAAKLDGGVA